MEPEDPSDIYVQGRLVPWPMVGNAAEYPGGGNWNELHGIAGDYGGVTGTSNMGQTLFERAVDNWDTPAFSQYAMASPAGARWHRDCRVGLPDGRTRARCGLRH